MMTFCDSLMKFRLQRETGEGWELVDNVLHVESRELAEEACQSLSAMSRQRIVVSDDLDL